MRAHPVSTVCIEGGAKVYQGSFRRKPEDIDRQFYNVVVAVGGFCPNAKQDPASREHVIDFLGVATAVNLADLSEAKIEDALMFRKRVHVVMFQFLK